MSDLDNTWYPLSLLSVLRAPSLVSGSLASTGYKDVNFKVGRHGLLALNKSILTYKTLVQKSN